MITFIGEERRIKYLINKSIALKHLAKHDSAYIDMHSALKLAKKLNDRNAKSKVMNQLGLIAKDLENYQEAIYYFDLANREESSYKTFHNIGEVYKELNQYDSAESNYLKSISLSKSQVTLFKSHQSIGEIHHSKRDTSKALTHLLKAEKLLAEMDNVEVEDLELYSTLASCYKLGKPDRELYLNKEIASLRKINKKQEVLKTQYRKLYISSFKEQYDHDKERDILYNEKIQLLRLVFGILFIVGLISFLTFRKLSKYKKKKASISVNIEKIERLTKQPLI